MKNLTLSELSEISKVPARTIRYYISRGLLSGPETGQDAGFSDEHIIKLDQIRLQHKDVLPLGLIAELELYY